MKSCKYMEARVGIEPTNKGFADLETINGTSMAATTESGGQGGLPAENPPADTRTAPPSVRFTLDDAQRAADEWGANCGPGAVAAILGLTLDELRPNLGDFEQKRYTNPTLMWTVLRDLRVRVSIKGIADNRPTLAWPQFGLARVQWEGPWTAPGVPMRVRYRHTHWVGCVSDPGWSTGVPGSSEPTIFDINCICVGGWVPLSEWATSVVPWLLQECEPKANGRWHLTHSVEVIR